MVRKAATLAFVVVACLFLSPRSLNAQTGMRRFFSGPDSVGGGEFAAAVNSTARNLKTTGTVFVPDKVRRVRAIIVLVEQGPRSPLAAQGRFGDMAWRSLAEDCECALLYLRVDTVRQFADDTPMVSNVLRNAAVGGGEALVTLMQRLSQESARPDLGEAPMLFWGWSAAASFGTTFAQQHPERTAAFIRYHTQLRGVPADVAILKNVPALLIAGAKDETAGTSDAQALWKAGRAAGAPWTFAIEPDASHASEEALVTSHQLILPWIRAVVAQRTSADKSTLRPVTDAVGMMGDNRTAEVTWSAAYSGVKADASWLPDEVTAQGWRAVLRGAKPPVR
jgi:dienelactone hydrolase